MYMCVLCACLLIYSSYSFGGIFLSPCSVYLSVLCFCIIKLQKAGDSELLSRFTEENVVVLESRASGKTLRFREGEVEGIGGHGALGK